MIYDVIIVGAGPGGLSASIYLKRAGRNVLVLEGGVAGGQMFLSHMVENYPGFIEAISGQKLSYNMEEQAKRLGVLFKNVMI
ncbi:MAG: FAD-dependent oxidoreductase, partial [Candidatus Pacebacteria bacterium]|nr:FAD-dependent oxidoreductase [Candidatus Paceibacterota bacterium]